MPVSYTNFEKSPYSGRGETPLPHPPLALPPLTNLGCTTVTGIAKMHKGAMPPPHWSASKTKEERKEKGKIFPETNSLGKEWKKNKSRELVYATT